MPLIKDGMTNGIAGSHDVFGKTTSSNSTLKSWLTPPETKPFFWILSLAVGRKRTLPLTLALPTLTMPAILARSPLVLVFVGSYFPLELRFASAELKLSLVILLPFRSIPARAPLATGKRGAVVVPTRRTRFKVVDSVGMVT